MKSFKKEIIYKALVVMTVGIIIFFSYPKWVFEPILMGAVTWDSLKNDEKHLLNLLGNSNYKLVMQKEINMLKDNLEHIRSEGIQGSKGYIVYVPTNARQQDILRLAITAREDILQEPNNCEVVISKYYTGSKHFIRNNFLAVNDPIKIEKYDLESIFAYLDNLALPDYLLEGLEIYLTSYRVKEMDGLSVSLSTKGAVGERISVFNSSNTISILAHELGHIVGTELCYDYDFAGLGSPNNFYQKYAKLYGKENAADCIKATLNYIQGGLTSQEYLISWREAPQENFAEDFALLTLPEYYKHTSWVDYSKRGDVKKLIYNQLPTKGSLIQVILKLLQSTFTTI